MFKKIWFLLVCTLFVAPLFGQAFAKAEGQGSVIPHDFIVQLNGAAPTDWSVLIGFEPQTVRLLDKELGLWQLKDTRLSAQWMEQYAHNFLSASPNHRLANRETNPNDPLFGDQWGLASIRAGEFWELSSGGKNGRGDDVVVAVLDKGFQIDHPDLIDNLWTNPGEIAGDSIDNDGNGFIDDVHGWNFTQNRADFNALDHGSNVAGIIGARGNNGEGVSGVNWDVKLLYLGAGNDAEAFESYAYVRELRERYNRSGGTEGAFIAATNLSSGRSGSCSDDSGWNLSYESLAEVGVLNTVSTPNVRVDIDLTGDVPSTCVSEGMLSVTNLTIDNNLYVSGSYGLTHVDLAAPGTDIATTGTRGDYSDSATGASFSAPFVAGAIALLYSTGCADFQELVETDPRGSAALVRSFILDGAQPVSDLTNRVATGGSLDLVGARDLLHAWCAQQAGEEFGNALPFGKFIEPQDILRVFPNPARETITMAYSAVPFQEVSLRITDMMGRMVVEQTVLTTPFGKQEETISVGDLAAGAYNLTLLSANEKRTIIFVKQ